ncbi:MAG: FlgD immunoglobulin-like domain containing protein [Candidatus Eisenbacteria bacterium]
MIKRTAMLGLAAVILLAASPALPADRVVLAEMFGGTWCGYCPEAHAALQVLTEEHGDEQLVALYYHIGGADPFRTSESQARASWYGVGGVPHVKFDGVETCIGVYEDLDLTIAWYQNKIDVRDAVMCPLEMYSTGQVQADTGYVAVTIKATGTCSYTPIQAQFVLVENDVFYNSNEYDFTVRDVLPYEALTLSSPGDSAVITRHFAVDPTWDYEKMRVVVFVEDTGLKEIVQAHMMPPPYDLHMTSDGYAAEIDYFGENVQTYYLENRGTATDTVSMNISHLVLPPGASMWDWWAQYCHEATGICYFGAQDFVLAPGQIDTFTFHMEDFLGYVQGMAVTEITAQSNGEPSIQLSEIYGTFVDVPSILLVDDDAGASYETHLETALGDAGYPAMVWDVDGRGRPSQTLIDSFWAAFWTTGGADGTALTLADEAVMADYLDGGGNLFISSMDYLSSRVAMTPFIENYLHIDSWSADVGGLSMGGSYGDQISHEMALGLLGGPIPPANSDSFVSDGGGDVTFTSMSTERGIKIEENGHKVAFISFPFEDVKTTEPDPNNQETLARRIVEWFMLPTGVEEGTGEVFAGLALKQNSPNPFNPVTTIRFSVPSGADRVALDVFNVNGRFVRSLVDEELSPGPHSAVWDGRDGSGREVSSGIYFARLAAGRETSSIKMTLLK